MPYKKTQNGIDFTGKIADMVLDFEKWFSEDFKNGGIITIGNYAAFLTISLSLQAKEKWQNSFLNKSKAKAIDNMITIHPNGTKTLNDVYATMDFLAENLSSEELRNLSKEFRIKIINQFKK